VHRIGRTGRAGREGVAITLAEPREHRLLRNIEQLTKQKIDVAQVPTVADLRAHRQELVKATLREAVLEGNLDPFRGIVEALAGEIDLMDLAAAAVKLVAARDGGEEAEIPAVTAREPRESAPRGDRPFGRERDSAPRGDSRERRPEGGAKGKKPKRDTPWTAATLWIGAGRKLKMRPGDLVGAIANEAGLDSAHIGSIQIADNFSTVEVPEAMADEVITALKSTKIKGLRVQVRRDRAR
jgi:ATP-dependent RNA helicase DeaD